ncbi:hypothetical protein RF11_02465 [Thelohanellus kitauei]|uniref:Uncharacterized protein n=1 Tax=Thelohanellus kitauei TaxID=669202 RepID=A0A0C2MRD3_THEKT|nr:hypothetical protein RF11_02465 [Thelohanellus kitauei]
MAYSVYSSSRKRRATPISKSVSLGSLHSPTYSSQERVSPVNPRSHASVWILIVLLAVIPTNFVICQYTTYNLAAPASLHPIDSYGGLLSSVTNVVQGYPLSSAGSDISEMTNTPSTLAVPSRYAYVVKTAPSLPTLPLGGMPSTALLQIGPSVQHGTYPFTWPSSSIPFFPSSRMHPIADLHLASPVLNDGMTLMTEVPSIYSIPSTGMASIAYPQPVPANHFGIPSIEYSQREPSVQLDVNPFTWSFSSIPSQGLPPITYTHRPPATQSVNVPSVNITRSDSQNLYDGMPSTTNELSKYTVSFTGIPSIPLSSPSSFGGSTTSFGTFVHQKLKVENLNQQINQMMQALDGLQKNTPHTVSISSPLTMNPLMMTPPSNSLPLFVNDGLNTDSQSAMNPNNADRLSLSSSVVNETPLHFFNYLLGYNQGLEEQGPIPDQLNLMKVNPLSIGTFPANIASSMSTSGFSQPQAFKINAWNYSPHICPYTNPIDCHDYYTSIKTAPRAFVNAETIIPAVTSGSQSGMPSTTPFNQMPFLIQQEAIHNLAQFPFIAEQQLPRFVQAGKDTQLSTASLFSDVKPTTGNDFSKSAQDVGVHPTDQDLIPIGITHQTDVSSNSSTTSLQTGRQPLSAVDDKNMENVSQQYSTPGIVPSNAVLSQAEEKTNMGESGQTTINIQAAFPTMQEMNGNTPSSEILQIDSAQNQTLNVTPVNIDQMNNIKAPDTPGFPYNYYQRPTIETFLNKDIPVDKVTDMNPVQGRKPPHHGRFQIHLVSTFKK